MLIVAIYLGLSFVSIFVILTLAYQVWLRRHLLPPVARYFLLACLGGLLWAGGEIGYILSTSATASRAWNELSVIGSGLVPFSFLASLAVLNRRFRPWLRWATAVHIAVLVGIQIYKWNLPPKVLHPQIPAFLAKQTYELTYVSLPSPAWLTLLWVLLTFGFGLAAIAWYSYLYAPVWGHSSKITRGIELLLLGLTLLGAFLNIVDFPAWFQYLEAFPPMLWFFFHTFAGGILRLHFDVSSALSGEAVLHRLDEGTLIFDPRDRLIWWNQKAERLLKLEREKHRGRFAHEVLGQWPWLFHVYRSRETWPRQVQWLENGHERTWEVYSALLKSPTGHALGWTLVFRDLTEQRRLEQALRFRAQSEMLYRSLMGLAIEPLSPDEVMKQGLKQMFQTLAPYGLQSLALYRASDGMLTLWLREGQFTQALPQDLPLEDWKEQRLWENTLFIPLRANGDILGALWAQWSDTILDLHNTLQQAGELLAHLVQVKHEDEHLRLLREVYRNIQDAVILFDGNFHILAVNPATERLTGYNEEELLHIDLPQIFGFAKDYALRAFREIRTKGQWVDHLDMRTKNGERRVVEARVTQVPLSAKRHLFVAVLRDLTETQSLQAELARQRVMLEHLLKVARGILRAPIRVESVFEQVVEVGRDTTGAPYFALGLLSETGLLQDLLMAQYGTQLDKDFLKRQIQTSLEQGVLREIIQRREVVYVGDAYTQAPWSHQAHLYPWRAIFIVPLFYGKQPLGFFFAGHTRPHGFTEEHQRILQGLAEILALGLHQTRLYEEQIRLADERLRAKEREEWLRRREERFFANISHEMRTPLQILLGYLEMWTTQYPDDTPLAAIRKEMNEVQASAQMLHSLIDQLLDFQKTKAEPQIVAKDFTWKTVMEEVLPLVEPLMARNQNEFHVDVDTDLEMHTDSGKLRHILLNLLSNAAKFTLQGEVRLSVCARERNGVEGVEIRVSDTGIGIPEDAKEAIFAPFVQARTEIAHRFGGTGLGLALVKEYVHLLGGEIVDVESQVGQGTTFIVWLPRRVHLQQGEPSEKTDESTPETG